MASSGVGTIWGFQEPVSEEQSFCNAVPGFALSDTMGLSCPVVDIPILFTWEQAVPFLPLNSFPPRSQLFLMFLFLDLPRKSGKVVG